LNWIIGTLVLAAASITFGTWLRDANTTSDLAAGNGNEHSLEVGGFTTKWAKSALPI
jgi:hypothetical protein